MFFCVEYPVHPTERAMPQRRAEELTGRGYSVLVADARGMAGPQRAAFVLTNIVTCDPCMILPADSADGVAEVIFRRKYATSPLPLSDTIPWLASPQAQEELNPSIARMLGLAAHQKLRSAT